MDKKPCVSRRASLKSLGAIGAAVAMGRAAEAAEATTKSEPAAEDQAMQPSEPVELAIARFTKGHSCAQAVFSAFAEQMGLDYATAVRLSAGFGGGMGMGSVCGAATGAIMAIGLRYGGVDPRAKEQTGKLVHEFMDHFKAQHKSLNCRDLLGCDLSTPEGRQSAKDKNAYAACPDLVASAARILTDLLNRDRVGADS